MKTLSNYFIIWIFVLRFLICRIQKKYFLIIILGIITFNTAPLSAQEFVERYISNIAYSPDYAEDHTIFICSWGSGLFKSSDQGNTWQKIDIPIHEGDSENHFEGLAFSPNYSFDKTIFVGAESIYRSTDAGESWEWLDRLTPAITNIAISPNFKNDQTVFASTFGGNLYRNTQRGDGSWQQLNTGYGYLWSVTLSPEYALNSTLFVGTSGGGIYRSQDQGETWENVRDDLLVMSVEIQKDGGAIYAATYEGVIQSINNGDTWTILSSGLQSLVCRDLSLSPDFSSDQTVFLGTADGVFKSTNQGTTWILSNSGITTPYIYTIAVSPSYSTDHTLLAGTAEGLFKSTNAGLLWLPVNNGLDVKTIRNITKSPFIFDALPSCAIGPNNILHVVWTGLYENVNGPDGVVADVFYMKRENGIWSQPKIISVPSGYYSRDVTINVDQEGKPYLVFRRSMDQINILQDDDIYYTYDNGADFIQPVIVVDGTGSIQSKSGPSNPSIAIDHSGIVHISYTANTGTGKAFYINNSSGSFDTPVEIMSSEYIYPSTDLALDHNGIVHFAIGASFNWPKRDIYYVNNLGGSFSAPLIVSEDNGNTGLAISLDSKDNVHILYCYDVNGDKKLGYVCNKTGSFSNPEYIMGYHHPSLFVDSKDNVHIAAQEVDSSPFDAINEIAYANNKNGEFIDGKITDLTSGTATVGKRYIAVGPDDSVHVVYGNGTMGSYDLYYLCFSPDNICSNPTNGGTIASDQTGSNPFDPVAFTSTALPAGHTGTLDYKWQKSTFTNSDGFNDISSSNSATYDPGSISQTTWYKRIARVTCMNDWEGIAESNVLTITISPITSTESPLVNNIIVYPNPGKNNLTISANAKISNIKIYNSKGQIVRSAEKQTANQVVLDISDLTSGVYFLKVSSDGSIITRSIIKK
jgi:photosystem II stability/assembly factor-like uncharacterized protein